MRGRKLETHEHNSMRHEQNLIIIHLDISHLCIKFLFLFYFNKNTHILQREIKFQFIHVYRVYILLKHQMGFKSHYIRTKLAITLNAMDCSFFSAVVCFVAVRALLYLKYSE